jgi:hypothetical protein
VAEPRAVEQVLKPSSLRSKQVEAHSHRAFEFVTRLVEPSLPFDGVYGLVSLLLDVEHRCPHLPVLF